MKLVASAVAIQQWSSRKNIHLTTVVIFHFLIVQAITVDSLVAVGAADRVENGKLVAVTPSHRSFPASTCDSVSGLCAP